MALTFAQSACWDCSVCICGVVQKQSVTAYCLQKIKPAISHFPIENRKASMDYLEGQRKVAENFKS